ncbi:glutathione S-transferase family protein [Falsiroseomonas tokyonensis]|uniref:Glutathione S-transferase family protein n=1 Tax=Falsiroseomonas tokyonensis TaxID=430521 RepID=A0ABV7BMM0_9PROT|nr:glutathione S-transferase family protein [Falsiroseomonas tokyonensis]MBU8536805.1 glutathione S-transferase [Falsiroseomonas tokyonensis]
MLLHWSPRSPFVRKVMIFAHETGLADRITTTRTPVAMLAPHAGLMTENPLSKIPTLRLEDGSVLYDSYVICEYLDTLHGGPRLIPAEGPARFLELRRHALGTGFLDLLILWRNERDRAQPLQPMMDAFAVKTKAALAAVEAEIDSVPRGLAQFTFAVLGSYLDFRFADLDWRANCPRFAAFHAEFEKRPSMQATLVTEG